MKHLLAYLLAIVSFQVLGQQYIVPYPHDVLNTPMTTANGVPFTGTMTATTSSYDNAVAVTVPLTGINVGRPYKSVSIYNPSTTRTVVVCFGTAGQASSCSDNVSIPPGLGLALDFVLYGSPNNKNTVFGRLDSAGSSAITVNMW